MELPSVSDRFLSRRRLLQLSGLSGLGLVLGGCASTLYDDVVFKTFEPINQSVEELLLNPQKLIPNFPVSAIEPEALLINSFQGTPKIDPQAYLLTVNGDVNHSFTLSLAELQKMPSTSMVIRHVCVEGWAAIVQWGGVPLRDLIALARPKEGAKYVYFKSADGYYESWDLVSSMHPQTLMVYQKNGQPLSPENGAPLRLASPIKLGYKQSKWVTEITLTKQLYPKKGYWEDLGYEWFGGL
ncbi:MAG: molybdopterin-dependent oxidoreductase [Drouetiella hepatica Uher 2000/2452]|uniref:Molybdopterin-dependent oxidoreductase n=1 Tax=Drouetiella hepatica Uher 2000/2452 TaxID=904376 RepID=A0A951QH64_9CYAN|nr:molybdopterin-dependent oxidoreductase [Drouetiella hepatica Uher 2000/2452]